MNRAESAARAAILLLVAATALPALGCGYCIEDRIAAVYDHGVRSRALDRDHQVAFFAIEGTFAPRDAAAGRAIVETTPGVDRSSVRVSDELASVSFAFDPGRGLVDLQRRIERRLKSRGLTLSPLRIMDRQSAAGR